MEWTTRRSPDRVGWIAMVLGGHWLLIEVLFGSRFVGPQPAGANFPELSLWIPVKPDTPPEDHERIEKNAHHTRARISQPVRTELPAAEVAAPAQPSVAPVENVPDWMFDAHSVAQSMAPRLIDELQDRCAAARRLAQALPAGCKQEGPAKTWEPEPQRAGFVGIFPYVRVGRCIIGLGFWGCAVQTPVPDGTLLEDFRNPNRPVGSVPDLPVQTLPQAPIPQAFK